MGFFEKIGLGRKKKEQIPLLGDKKKKDIKKEVYSLKRNPYVRVMIFLLFILTSIFSLPRTSVNTGFVYTQGQPWRADDLTAPFTFSLNKTPQEIKTEEEEVRSQNPLIFEVDATAGITIQTRLDSLYRTMQPVLESYHEWQISKEDNASSVFDDSLRFSKEYTISNIGISESSLNVLLKSYHDIKSKNLNYSRFDGVIIKIRLESLIDQLLTQGVIDQNKNNIQVEVITVLNPAQSTERPVNIARVRDLKEANEFAQFQLNRSFNENKAQLA